MGIFDSLFGKKVSDEKEIEKRAKEWVSRDYRTFIKEEHPQEEEGFVKFYTNACKLSEKILKLKASEKMKENLRLALLTTDLNITPDQVLSLTVMTILLPIIITIPILTISTFIAKSFSFLFILPFVLPLVLAYFFYTYPNYLSIVTKIRANDETVKVILYMVIYLRLNPQIEGAVAFAAAHSTGPIGKDLRKIMWDLEVRSVLSINQAIGSKIEKWLLWDKEFVESMNLIQALSLETNEQSREKTLDKTLTFILDSTQEKMKEYSRDLRTPITMIHTMGITFPIMGLVMFPMIAIFLNESFNPGYLIAGYIFFLPLTIYFYLRRTISKRPGAFSYPDISHHPDLPPENKILINISGKKQYISTKPIAIILTALLIIPSISYFFILTSDYLRLHDSPEEWGARIKIEYDNAFSFMMYSISGIWAAGIGLAIYFLGQSYQRLKIRNDVKMIEDEFQIGLFRLGDVLSSGIPIESALEETLEKYRQYKLQSSPMYTFFSVILKNIKQMGMTLKKAVFDPQYGVILKYPSVLITDVMQIIVSASEKSSAILSTASKTISAFLMKTKSVENLLKEMLDEISAAIQLQSSFIAPFICGIVAGMATFIIQMLQKISDFLSSIEESFNMGGTFVHGGTMKFGEMMGMIRIERVIPATVFQLVVGIYMIEIVMILAYFQNGIKNGFDKTTRNVLIGKALITALIIYSVVFILGLFISVSFMPALGSLGS
jgi:hypothetical protein